MHTFAVKMWEGMSHGELFQKKRWQSCMHSINTFEQFVLLLSWWYRQDRCDLWSERSAVMEVSRQDQSKEEPKGKGGWSGNVFQKKWLRECSLGLPLYFLLELGKHILYMSAGFLLSRLFSSYEVSGTALNMSCVFSQFFFPKWHAIGFNIILFVMSWIVCPPTQIPLLKPLSQYLWRWLYWEIGPLKRKLS